MREAALSALVVALAFFLEADFLVGVGVAAMSTSRVVLVLLLRVERRGRVRLGVASTSLKVSSLIGKVVVSVVVISLRSSSVTLARRLLRRRLSS